ncbi:MAG: TIGR00282 family metallophosphoesterase [Vampirovibrionales bacterium]|nr:TIGR00282 family metallophosphoesterase [Vampirovibrionales bacterium]
MPHSLSTEAKSPLEILFFGDLVGRPGRTAVKTYLKRLLEETPVPKYPRIIAANVENASHGFGLSLKQYQELKEAGIQVFTSGNHIWDRKDIFSFIDQADALVRPANFPAGSPGVGYRIFEVEGIQLAVINLIGQVYMGTYNSPWDSLDNVMQNLKAITPNVFLDFHAEATAEKNCMGYYAASLGVSAMVGTHTHVQTADERIIEGQMGYITDAGCNGVRDSVIGMDAENSLKRLKTQLPVRLDVAEGDPLQVNAVRFILDSETGRCHRVERIHEVLSCLTVPEATLQTT